MDEVVRNVYEAVACRIDCVAESHTVWYAGEHNEICLVREERIELST